MKPLTIVALLAAGVWGFTLLMKAGAAKALNFVVNNVVLGTSGSMPAVILTLLIQNPTDQQYTLKSLAGSLYLNGVQIGNVSSFQQITIAANSQTPYQVTVLVSAVSLIEQISEALTGSQIQANFEFIGTVNVDTLTVPIDVNYRLV